MGQVEDNWEFDGQLKVKLYKSKEKDQNKKKTCKVKVNNEFLTGIQLHKIKSLKPIRGVIEPIKN